MDGTDGIESDALQAGALLSGLLIPILSFREIAFSPAAVGAGVGATKEGKMAPNFHKRHQVGQLDFRSFRLLTEGLLVRI